ncbi:hypothetical protein [Neobacillus sp. FSL H8-0543]|uniref:hypothetical protein n=1 Tax=Neobacillus sp. FSL H8-0543 TaxID=2954672 RepID=UPI0031584F16
MVIQPNMSSKSIIEIWENTIDVFQKHNISISEVALEKVVERNILNSLIKKLNDIVGSSSATCIEGG